MDKLRAMAVLLKTVEAGSLSAAARELDMPLATVSRRIAELEAGLKTRLLNRSSRRLGLTEAGRLYVEASRGILERVEEAEHAATGMHKDPRGQLTVTASVVFGRLHLIPIISGFMTRYPEIDVKLVLSDRLLRLPEDEIDVAVRIGDLGDSSLIAAKVGSVRRVTCASPSYLAARGRPRTPDDLRDHICVTFDNLASPGAWRFSSPQGDVLAPIRSRLTVTTAEAAVDGAVAGLGLTRLLSYQITEPKRAGHLELVLEDYELPAWPVSLVYAGHPQLPGKLRAFLDFVAPQLRSRLQVEAATFDGRA